MLLATTNANWKTSEIKCYKILFLEQVLFMDKKGLPLYLLYQQQQQHIEEEDVEEKGR